MRATWSRSVAGLALGAAFLGLAAPSANGQFPSLGAPLGGYGAASGSVDSGQGMIIPYGGMTVGFMPTRMGGPSLSFTTRRSDGMGSSRAPFGLSTMSGGMGRGLGASSSLGSSGGMGLGGGRSRLGSGRPAMGVMPTSIGYPFRQPPSLVAPSSTGAGMSM